MVKAVVTSQLIHDLRQLGVKANDTLLVHSSLKSLGWVDGGALTVIAALVAALSEGTLLMPALSYRFVTKENPSFAVNRTPSCVGTIPETFRLYPGVVRSVHPTHSVCAYGARALNITSNHYLDRTPVGANSPFRLLPAYGGKILMLGCGLKPNTYMHGVEEAMGLSYVLEEKPTLIAVEDSEGKVEMVSHTMHHFQGVVQRYDRITHCLNVVEGRVLAASAFLIDTRELEVAAQAKLKEEPWFFVDQCPSD